MQPTSNSNKRQFDAEQEYYVPLDGRTIPSSLAVLNLQIQNTQAEIKSLEEKITALRKIEQLLSYLQTRVFNAASEQDMLAFAKEALQPLLDEENPIILSDEEHY